MIDLQVLRVMSVTGCDSLKSLFPAGVAKKDVTCRLEELEVRECRELVEIFSKGGEAEGATKMFGFSSLTSLTLTELPKLKYFYPGLHKLEWPVLQELDAFQCEPVKLKCEEDDAEEQVLIEIEKVIQTPSLKKVSLSIGDIQVTWDRESVGGQLQFDKLKDFEELLDSAPLYRFLHMFPNSIQKLAFNECEFDEMFSAERPNADMNELKSIGSEHSWLQPFLENLQTLQVKCCYKLSNLVPSSCTVSFTNLTYLEVSSCNGLIYLFTFSTAKSLGGLKRLKIKKCKSLIEIVSKEGDESDEDEQIIFKQLQVLYLKELRWFRWFYPGNYTLRFPCLEQVHVIDCWWMKTFSPNNIIDHSTTTKWFSAKYESSQQCSDLNSTAHRIFEEKLRNLEDLEVVGDEWKMIWHGVFEGNLFLHKLKALSFKRCETDVFPCEFLQHVPNIERLEVRDSSFDHILCFESHNEDDIGLENFWIQPILRNLTVLKIYHCNSLECLFISSTVKSLAQLKTMEIRICDSIEEIVVCNKEGDESNEDEIIFPQLNSLNLFLLPNLKRYRKSRQIVSS
ncbi:uncharacterized protein LOC114916212 [Cajanus cajan]|uniref:uncharacterized protein LOC114916212 n=1 Tax=Cajanus cajan TaxID=3821 RepID=UPI0010FB50E4|nr:uncharacterized protein LOC114916212 [Cajanus cajan]